MYFVLIKQIVIKKPTNIWINKEKKKESFLHAKVMKQIIK